MDITTNQKYDETTRFRVAYERLKSVRKLRFFKPCYKRYLSAHVKSRFAYVSPTEWEIATFLPTADWRKSNASSVYKDSRGMI